MDCVSLQDSQAIPSKWRLIAIEIMNWSWGNLGQIAPWDTAQKQMDPHILAL
jgi:hypothetical protein